MIYKVYMKFINLYFYAMLVSVTSTYGQSQIRQVINFSGASSKNKCYSVEWSIGELALINEMDSPDSSYILTNGFIQPEDTIVSVPFKSTPVIFKNIQLSSDRHSAVSQSNSRYFRN